MASNNWQSFMTQWNRALVNSSLRSEIPEVALQTMLERMTPLPGGEGYRIALYALHRAKF